MTLTHSQRMILISLIDGERLITNATHDTARFAYGPAVDPRDCEDLHSMELIEVADYRAGDTTWKITATGREATA